MNLRLACCAVLCLVTLACSSSTPGGTGGGSAGGSGGGGGGGSLLGVGGGGGSGTGGGGMSGAGGGAVSGAGGGAAQSVEVTEQEPNGGPGFAQLHDLGTFSEGKIVVVKGRLATGGNDGVKYTGDFDGFAFNIATAGGTLGAYLDWDGTADVDMVVYDANLTPIFAEGTTAKPIASTGPAPAGKFAVVLYSKDLPADWTLTLSYSKPVVGAGGSCTSTLVENPSGGCKFTLIAPANGESLVLPAELGFSSCGCETPARVYIYGNPPTPQNSYYIEKLRGTAPICSWTGRTSITQADLTQFGITSDNGVYHWQVRSFHGSLSAPRTFTLAPTVCK